MKKILARMLALMLILTSALAGFGLAQAEKAPKKLYLLLVRDQQDTVLTDAEKFAAVKLAAGMLAHALPGGSELVIGATIEEYAEWKKISSGEDAVEDAMAAVEQRQSLNAPDKKVSSNTVKALKEIAQNDPEAAVIVVGDYPLEASGDYWRDRKQEFWDIADGICWRSLKAQDTEKYGKAMELMGIENYQDVNLDSAQDMGIELAKAAMAGLDDAPEFYPIGDDFKAYGLLENPLYVQNGVLSIEPPQGDCVALATVNLSMEIGAIDPIQPAEQELKIPVDSVPGVTTAYYLTKTGGEEKKIDTSDGTIPGEMLPVGEYTLRVEAFCPALNVKEDVFSATFKTAEAPIFQGEQTNFSAWSTPEFPEKYVVEGLNPEALFEDAKEVTLNIDDKNFAVEQTEDGLAISGEVEGKSQTVKVTLTAEAETEGLKPVIQDLTVQLHSFPALLAETSLQVSGNAGQYTEDEEIKWKFSVNSEQKAEITGTEGYEDWKNHIAVYLYLDDGSGEKQKLPGDIEKGWSYTTEAQTDEQTVRAYLTGGAAPEVGDKPACETEYTGYAQEKLLDNCLAEAKLTVTGGKPEYQMNDEISLQITAADAKLLQEAWDPDGKIVELEVKLAPEVEYDLTGALDEGWTLTFPARQDTQLRATLFAGEGQNRVEGEMYSAICTVAGRSLPEHLACLLHGKEDWEFQPSMMNRLYLVAGIVAAVLVVLAVVILWGTKKNFVGMLTIEVDTDVEHYQSKIIDLRDWKKKKVAFGALLSGSGLPPITALTASDVMNKLFIKPVKGGIRVINKTRTLEGGNCPLTQESNQVSMTGGDGIAKISLIYKA